MFSAWALYVLMPQDRSALGIACRHCRTPVLDNHRDDKAGMTRWDTCSIVIYCSWTSSLAQPPKFSGHLYQPASPLCIADGNLQIQMVVVRKLFGRKIWLTHESEVNKQYFALIRWLDHLVDWTPHSMTKTGKIDQNLNFNRPVNSTVCVFKKKTNKIFGISVSNCIRKGAGNKTLKQKVKKGVIIILTSPLDHT